MTEDIAEKLKSVTAASNIHTDEDMGKHTTFRAGGKADVYVTPQSIREATDIVRLLLANEVSYTVMGNGSNLLVSDKGYRGCIVSMLDAAGDIKVCDNVISAGAGAMLSKVANAAYENALTGMEFASGIPGSLGGAVVMNAGAYGGEMKDIITSVTMFDCMTGDTVILSTDEMRFGYRTSIAKEHSYVVLEAQLEFARGDRSEIKLRMEDFAQRRKDRQPLEFPSAGSTFKRPEGHFAGKLIEDAGLGGYSVGGAQVSEKHCGFVINKGGARADDIIELINYVREKVYNTSGIMLEPEVVILRDPARG